MAVSDRSGIHLHGPIKNKVKRSGARQWYGDLNVGEEPDLCILFNDFLKTQDYDANDWTITTTEAGAGSATEAIAADEACGALVITNDAADNDVDSLQMNEENWRLSSGKQLWLEMRVKVLDVDQADMFIGLSITDTTPRDSSDRIGFTLADGSAALACESVKNSTQTASSAIATLADATYVKCGFHWDGKNKVEFFINGSIVATHSTNIPDDENLAVTLDIQNGQAVANSLTVDYIYVAQER